MSGAKPGAVRYRGFLGTVIAVSAALVALGYLPTARLGGPGAVGAMVAACAVSAFASAVSGLLLAQAGRVPRHQAVNLALGSLVVRLLLALMVGGAAAASGWLDTEPFLIWLAISYLALLVVDTGYALRVFKDPGATET